MVLIDSMYINNSGGKVLLDYLVETLERECTDCFYLFDDRCKNDFKFIPDAKKVFLKASLIRRHHFFTKNKNKFSKVLCFGNVPPTIKLNIPVYTYFHQLLFLDIPKSVSFLSRMKIKFKLFVLNFIKSNTNIWLVQTEATKSKLASILEVDINHIKLIPFYPPLKGGRNNISRRKDGFIYISNGGDHKNHFKLIEAFCNYFDDYHKGVLHITINEKFPLLLEFIKTKTDCGYPVVNHGFINRNNLREIYQTNEFLIFPSLAESFGLGLIEALESGCKVIGADLPYTYVVCNPSLVFNPLDISDIKRVFVESQFDNIKESKQLIFNEMDNLILLLK
jgi:glycosyltransferase involved in cell wall biosynthesis